MSGSLLGVALSRSRDRQAEVKGGHSASDATAVQASAAAAGQGTTDATPVAEASEWKSEETVDRPRADLAPVQPQHKEEDPKSSQKPAAVVEGSSRSRSSSGGQKSEAVDHGMAAAGDSKSQTPRQQQDPEEPAQSLPSPWAIMDMAWTF